MQHSSIESEIRIILDKLNIDYESNNRTVLNGLELDFYLPEYKLAIEVNGLYWHSEHFKETKYHLNKTLKCSEKGIQLLHFWEDDWNYKNNILKSILYSRLNLLKNKIWARKCKISDVSPKEAKLFLNENHIQGYSSSTYKIGLYYNGELVSLMTFGWRWTNGKHEFELIRFCNKIGYSVVGAASKLFKNFLKTCNEYLDFIISYADISIFSGDIYDKLGFEKVSLSKPNYFWVVDGKRRHRYNYSKKKLVNKGYDENKTGTEIMYELGYWRVFSCGQEKWIFNTHSIL